MAHQHPVKDTDLHFVIDPVTRVIKNNSGKIVIMQHDHQSEILTFELPRYIDTHDMSLSNTVRVHYINIGSSSKYEPVSGVYEITDLQIDPENENLVTCSWTLTNNTTQLEGTLNFIIRFSCLTGDTIDYSWSTAIYSGIIVAKTIDSSDYVMTAIPDILEQWKASLKGDPFTYEDFTPEQLEGLRGPAGVIVSETEPTNEDHPVWVRPSGEYIVENLGISGATVGQTVKIKAVDSSGVPTEWEAADMPSGGGGTDTSLGLTGATIGQTIKIKSVDENGVPTEWEAADAASGGGEQWELLVDYVTEEQSFNSTIPYINFSQDDNGNPIKCKAVYVEINGIVIRDGSNDIHIRYWFNNVPVWGSYVTANGRYSVTFCMCAIRSNGWASVILLDSNKNVSTRATEFTNSEINTIQIGSNNPTAVFLEPNANIRIYGVKA